MQVDDNRLNSIISTQLEIARMDLNLPSIMELIARRTQELCFADGATVEIAGDNELFELAATGLATPYLRMRFPLTSGLSTRCVHTGEPQNCLDIESDEHVNREVCRKVGVRSLLLVPLLYSECQVIGVLKVVSARVGAFTEPEVQTLKLMAGLASATMIKIYDVQDRQNQPTHKDPLHEQIDTRLDARTIELIKTNLALTMELDRRVRLEEELRASLAKEQKSHEISTQFVSRISHDLRTPLTSIQSSSDLLRYYSDRFSAEKKLEIFERINRSVRNLTGLLNDVVLIDQAGSGKLQFQPEAFFLTDFCKEFAAEFEAQALAESGQSLGFTCEADPGCVVLDKKLIRQMLSHLLSNAARYGIAPGVIELNLAYQADTIVLRVTDQGIGIPLKDQARVFDVFYRGSNFSNIQGSGLGLAIVRQCVELHKGTITFESIEGQGTTFTVKLPRTQF